MSATFRDAALLAGAFGLLAAALLLGGRAEAVIPASTSAKPKYNVDSEGRSGFEVELKDCKGSRSCTVELYTVPSGKKLVVTHITCAMQTDDNDGPVGVRLYDDAGGTETRSERLPVRQLGNQDHHYNVNVKTQNVYDAKSKLKIGLALESGDSFTANVRCTVVGYLVST